MNTEKESMKKYLENPIPLTVEDQDAGFEEIRKEALKKAMEISPDPVLLAWYEGKTGKSVPANICVRENKPAWIVFAESRGADIVIDVNDETYIFMFKGQTDPEQ